MTLSVIMANYNHAAWLPRALDALLQQRPAADEIVIVDDGSTDGSVAIIESFCARYPAIRLIRHDSNRGIAAAMASALDQISGEFLFAAAADDFVLPGLFANAIAALRAHPEAALFCSQVALVDRNDKVTGYRPAALPRYSSGFVSAAAARREIRRTDNWFIGTSVVYRRARLAEIGYFDRSLGSLTDAMANRLLAMRHGFCFDTQVLSTWRVYPESYSARSSLAAYENVRLIETAGRWIERNFPSDMRRPYRRLFERRLRFGMARLGIVWRGRALDLDSIGHVLGCGRIERKLLRQICSTPRIGAQLLLVWMTIRMRPFSLLALARSWLFRRLSEPLPQPQRTPKRGWLSAQLRAMRSLTTSI